MASPTPTFMTLLRTKYREHLGTLVKDRAALTKASTAEGFFAFCEDYLDKNPVVNTFYVGIGIGCIMADSTRFVFNRRAQNVSASVSKPGTMQPSNAIEITSGDGIGDGLPEGGIGI